MPNNLNYITVNSRKYDNIIHRSWKADFVEKESSLLKLFGRFESEVAHPFLGVIRRGTLSHEFFWLDRWYNVFRFHEPDGSFRNFYCNVNMPPTLNDGVLDYVDLDIDIIVNKNLTVQILDLDEFEINARKYFYPEDLREQVQKSLKELIYLVENQIFPFDYKF